MNYSTLFLLDEMTNSHDIRYIPEKRTRILARIAKRETIWVFWSIRGMLQMQTDIENITQFGCNQQGK